MTRERNVKLEIELVIESFASIVQMAKAGLGHGFVPIGVAKALGVTNSKLVHLPEPYITRPVSLIGRKSTLAKPIVRRISGLLSKQESMLTVQN